MYLDRTIQLTKGNCITTQSYVSYDMTNTKQKKTSLATKVNEHDT